MQGYQPAAGPSSGAHLAPRPPRHWRDSVNQLKGNGPAFDLLALLLFMQPFDVPCLAFHDSPLTRSHPRLGTLATAKAYEQAMNGLIECGLLKADGNRRYSFDPRAQQQMFRELLTNEGRQNACNDAAYILYNKLTDQAKLATCLPQHEEFWKSYFRHVFIHSRIAKTRELKMSAYSAIIAIGAARYAFKEGDFVASKKLLQTITVGDFHFTDIDTVLVLAENLNVENWAQFEVEFASPRPAGTAQQAVSVATSALELKLFQLKDQNPFYDDRHDDIATMKEDRSPEYAELCLGICIGNDSNELEKLILKYLYDGWYWTKRNVMQMAIENFGKALRVMGAQYEARVTSKNQGTRIRPSFPQNDLHKFSKREGSQYASLLRDYEADSKVRGPLKSRVFIYLYQCAWYSVVGAPGGGAESAKTLAEALEKDMAVEGCRSNLAWAHYHVARFLSKYSRGPEVAVAGELMKKAEVIGEELDGPMWNTHDLSESVKELVWRYGK